MSFTNNIAKVKSAYDIVDYLTAMGVELKPSGPDTFKAVCPLHDDSDPSFYVNQYTQSFRCYGCQAHGDIFDLAGTLENLNFTELLEKLADDKGITLEYSKSGEKENRQNYRVLREINAKTHDFFVKVFTRLNDQHPAKQEVLNRGLTLEPKNTDIRYGYASENDKKLPTFLSRLGYSDDDIVEAGVCYRDKNGFLRSFWAGRLMFPLHDNMGNVVGFSGREIPGIKGDGFKGKYVNTKETRIFKKNTVLFNFPSARKHARNKDFGAIYVCEGQFDVLAFAQAGFPNVVASSGTAFTTEQAKACRNAVGSGGEVVFCFDGDNAGFKASVEVFTKNPSIQKNAYGVFFDKGVDPCDLRQKLGDEDFARYVKENQKPLITQILETLLKDYDNLDEAKKALQVFKCAQVVSKVTSETVRQVATRTIALNTGLSHSAITEDVEQAMRDGGKSWANRVRKTAETLEITGKSGGLERPEIEGSTDTDLALTRTLLKIVENSDLRVTSRYLFFASLHLYVNTPILRQVDTYRLESLISKVFPKPYLECFLEAKNTEGDRFIAETTKFPKFYQNLLEQEFYGSLDEMNETERIIHFDYITDRMEATAIREGFNRADKELFKTVRNITENAEKSELLERVEKAIKDRDDGKREFRNKVTGTADLPGGTA